MNLLGFNIQFSRNTALATEPVPKGIACTPEEWLAGEDIGSVALSNAYEQVVWVYRAINVLAEQVANVPFLFSKGERGRENLITSGPLHEFYSRPHPHLNRFQYWELRVIWLMLRGECFRIPLFSDDSQPSTFNSQPGSRRRLTGVLILDPAHFQHIVEGHRLIGWRYTGFGPGTPLDRQVFLPEEVWFERLPNPFNFWRGLPPLQVAAMAAQTDFAAGAYMRGLIENNADSGLVVRTDKWLTAEQRTQIIAALKERKRGAGRADKAVLIAGCAEILQPRLTSSDLQFLENRKFSRGEICAAFGVPEEVVTTTDHAKYDVMAGARLNFIENRVAPLCARLEAGEEVTVRTLDPQAAGWFDLESLPILQEARRQRLAAAQAGFNMGVPFNELNRVLDLGFKPLPWGDRGFVPANLQLLGNSSSSSERQVGRAVPCPPPATGCSSYELPERLAALFLALKPAAAAQPTPHADPKLAGKLNRFYFEQRAGLLSALATAAVGALDAPVTLLDPTAEEERLLATLRPLLDAGELDEPALALHCEALRRHVSALHLLLAEGREEPREQLAARVKAFYNARG